MKTFMDYGINTTGKTTGQITTLCPKCSHSRKKSKAPCLSVNIDEGLWKCHHPHCGWNGTLEGKKINMPFQSSSKAYKKPVYTPLTNLPEKVIDWFKGRGISEEVLRRNKIGYGLAYMPQVQKEVNTIQFPFYRDGKTINIKYRDKDKNFKLSKDAELIFYALDDIKGDAAIIVEGEIDKLSLEMAGYENVLSIPNGAPSPETNSYEKMFYYLNSAKELLDSLKTIILAVDNDTAGQKLEGELVRRIGKEKCSRVCWSEDCKDANEVLTKHGECQL